MRYKSTRALESPLKCHRFISGSWLRFLIVFRIEGGDRFGFASAETSAVAIVNGPERIIRPLEMDSRSSRKNLYEMMLVRA